MDSYLQRFEKLAVFYNWERKNFAYLLGTLLRGRALKVYVRLSDEVANDYSKLKIALLNEYQIDADSYRKKFKESIAGDGESYVQLVSRMEQYLERWISLSGVKKDFEDLCDFLIRDQILSNCSTELRVFLKERTFKGSIELAECADRFMSAHKYLKVKKKGINLFERC